MGASVCETGILRITSSIIGINDIETAPATICRTPDIACTRGGTGRRSWGWSWGWSWSWSACVSSTLPGTRAGTDGSSRTGSYLITGGIARSDTSPPVVCTDPCLLRNNDGHARAGEVAVIGIVWLAGAASAVIGEGPVGRRSAGVVIDVEVPVGVSRLDIGRPVQAATERLRGGDAGGGSHGYVGGTRTCRTLRVVRRDVDGHRSGKRTSVEGNTFRPGVVKEHLTSHLHSGVNMHIFLGNRGYGDRNARARARSNGRRR